MTPPMPIGRRSHLPEVADRAEHYAHIGAATDNRAYRSVIEQFVDWCGDVDQVATLPASGMAVACFVLARHAAGIRPTTLRQNVTALNWWHGEHGLPKPGEAVEVQRVLDHINRTGDHRVKRAHAMTIDELAQVLERDHRRLTHVRTVAAAAISRATRLPVGTCLRGQLGSVAREPALLFPDDAAAPLVWSVGDLNDVLDAGGQLGRLLDRLRRDGCATTDQPLLTRRDGETITPAGFGRAARSLGLQFDLRRPWGTELSDQEAVDALRLLEPRQDRLRRLRDDALMLLLWFGALRLDEVRRGKVRDWSDALRQAGGAELFIPSAKSDTDGKGASVLVPTQAGDLRPAVTISAWIAAAGLRPYDPVIPSMQHGLGAQPAHYTNTGGLRAVLSGLADAAELEAHITGHSGRRGWVTAAVEAGIPLEAAKTHTRHALYETLRVYAERDAAGDTRVALAVRHAIEESTAA